MVILYWLNGVLAYTQDGDTTMGTARVGSYLPNGWGLYDMHGNVWEWCLDWYETYPEAAVDPADAASGLSRVKRGGSWADFAQVCRSACRSANFPSGRFSRANGFRLARTLP